MIDKLKLVSHLIRNMGWRYVRFRAVYELKRKTGLLKTAYPTKPPMKNFIALEDWRASKPAFFFASKKVLRFDRRPSQDLQAEYEKMQAGEYVFFNALKVDLGLSYDWVTNPSTGYRYDPTQHWTEVEDITTEAGDIKYTWEKSRFSFLYTLLRYDYHFEKDSAEQVFQEIESWISANPINSGPNYKCSQEISLRVLNWTFALYYYSEHPALTEARFQRIMHAIYWMLRHVYENIHFSRISVRNNHAITETCMLYLSGLLFPFFPEVAKWHQKGKAWMEEEVAYQVYEDGTHLQFSMNYHRVVLQCLTWVLYLSEIHGQQLSDTFIQRVQASLKLLYAAQNPETGHLPNYGANDGALFFKWNGCSYRDYRPQLNAAYYFFNKKHLYQPGPWTEDVDWIGTQVLDKSTYPAVNLERPTLARFEKGGYYLIRDQKKCSSFIRCGQHKDRPSQADNLHLDVWYEGENILRDVGSYKYNTTPEELLYFNGTTGHNTIVLNDQHQMLKGPRFIWLYWSQARQAQLQEMEEYWLFEGEIQAFQQLEPGLKHRRIVKHYKNEHRWEIQDQIIAKGQYEMHQYWNIGPGFDALGFQAICEDEAGKQIEPQRVPGFYSSYYGIKEPSEALVFSANTDTILKTTIFKS